MAGNTNTIRIGRFVDFSLANIQDASRIQSAKTVASFFAFSREALEFDRPVLGKESAWVLPKQARTVFANNARLCLRRCPGRFFLRNGFPSSERVKQALTFHCFAAEGNQMSLGKKVRFELFKRDKFTCQYCGRTAPDVVLHADHIEPKSKGGSDDLLNLLTSCIDCNLGKSDRRLDDASVITKQKAQLDALQERREQIEMMLDWQKELHNLDDMEVEAAADYWALVASPFYVNDNGKRNLKQWLVRFGLEEVLVAIKKATDQYLILEQGKPTKESIELAFSKIPGICGTRKKLAEKPHLEHAYHVKNILKQTVGYVNDKMFFPLMDDVAGSFTDWNWVKGQARTASSWTRFYNTIYAEVYQDETAGEK